MAEFLAPALRAGTLLDPAVGPGALLSACHDLVPTLGRVTAFEVDPSVLSKSSAVSPTEYPAALIEDLRIEDFILADMQLNSYDAVIANPPYIRHHRLSPDIKNACQAIARSVLGYPIDGRAGIHVFFLLKCLAALRDGGRLAFIVSSDVAEGVFAEGLWGGVLKDFALKGVLTFDGPKAAFSGIDTNALILFLERSPAHRSYSRLRWRGEGGPGLAAAVREWAHGTPSDLPLEVETRHVTAGLRHGLTRRGVNDEGEGLPFGSVARCIRGIATGGNAFFCLTSKQVSERGLNPGDFVRCIGRVRDLRGDVVDEDLLEQLDHLGRPTYLLNLRRDTRISPALADYLDHGVRSGVASGSLVAQRSVWFEMEHREPPPILFTYLGRRATRFVRNQAGVVPLTGFLCVYPLDGVPVERLLAALNHPDTGLRLSELGKSYGSGAIKVEPGAMRRLVVPASALETAELGHLLASDRALLSGLV